MRKLSFWRDGRSSSRSKVRGSAVDWLQTYALALTMAGIVLVTVAAVAGLVADTASESARPTLGPPEILSPTPDPIEPQPELDVLQYVNTTHGYGFDYPAAWTVREDPELTSLENPSGRIRVLFGLGPSGDLDAATTRLIDSLPEVASNPDLIGMTRERIDGSASVLVSGTATDDAGRRVRFLAISVRGEPRNYSISVFVPRESDPARVLPQIEEIVSSFDVTVRGEELSV
jgi:hypothetical protein